jgi:hypothetical protein
MTDDHVLTPGGFRHKSLVHPIEPGHAVTRLDTGEFAKVHLATKKTLKFTEATGQLAQFAAHGPAGSPKGSKAPPPGALPNGWQAFASWDSGDQSITYFATEWTVPPAPATSSGQIVYLFSGIQNAGANSGILQPVLQWGESKTAGGGPYWTVANWYMTSGGQAFHSSNLVRVSPGDKLKGVMTQTGVSGASYDYSATFDGIANTTLPVSNIARLHWANETLECYKLTKCSDMPATSDTAMAAIEIRIGSAHPPLKWTADNAITGCGQHTVIASNANPGGSVELHYK